MSWCRSADVDDDLFFIFPVRGSAGRYHSSSLLMVPWGCLHSILRRNKPGFCYGTRAKLCRLIDRVALCEGIEIWGWCDTLVSRGCSRPEPVRVCVLNKQNGCMLCFCLVVTINPCAVSRNPSTTGKMHLWRKLISQLSLLLVRLFFWLLRGKCITVDGSICNAKVSWVCLWCSQTPILLFSSTVSVAC